MSRYQDRLDNMVKGFNKEDLEQIQFTRDRIGIGTLERYTGSRSQDFQPYILLTNFSRYVKVFSEIFEEPIHEGSVMSVCHSKKNRISIINYTVGSPMAALLMELLSFIKPKATLMLGMCGGLRKEFAVGSFFLPNAAIRDEGTSDSFMPRQCPALSSFVIHRYVCEELERRKLRYHNGVIHTTNVRFWEFKKEIRDILKKERVQAIDMECATLFSVGFYYYVPVGALMLISDLPLQPKGIKTSKSASAVFKNHARKHIEAGITCMQNMQKDEKRGFHYHF